MRGYVVQKGSRFYAVIYEGVDPLTGRERRRWYPAGESRQEAGIWRRASPPQPRPLFASRALPSPPTCYASGCQPRR